MLDIEIEMANIIGKAQGNFKSAMTLLNNVLNKVDRHKNPDIVAKGRPPEEETEKNLTFIKYLYIITI
ncbi:MAG: hypothetical protein B5M53_00095 [Candidatus Cloacimonas sp. 4484_209]|nr:MAG: hypothetical protein B5M53_00095 [Candidatus Cloacimonas sp. 4484_209]